MADYPTNTYDPTNPKQPPTAPGLNPQAQALLQQFIQGIGNNPQYNQGMAGMEGALGQQSGYDVVKGMLPQLYGFMNGGGKAADAYQTQGLNAVHRGFTTGINDLNAGMGAGGNLGGTLAGVSMADLGSRALGAADTVRANAAGMRESNMMGRLGAGMQGLSQLGGFADTSKAQNMSGWGNFANTAQQQGQINQNQYGQGIGQAQNLWETPWNQDMQQWGTIFGKPNNQSDLMQGVNAVTNMIGSLKS